MGKLYLVSTPIGNLEDITVRGLKVIFGSDYIICEDTRRSGQLIINLKSKYKNLLPPDVKNLQLISFYDEVEFEKVPQLISLLESGSDLTMISDSGTPLISDPGFKLVRSALERNIQVISIPGPTAGICALTGSGLPVNQFLFLGFLPEKESGRFKLLSHIKNITAGKKFSPTVIFYSAPHKLEKTLNNLKEVFGDIDIVIARELTKIHEQVLRDKISEVLNSLPKIKGEIVVLFNLQESHLVS